MPVVPRPTLYRAADTEMPSSLDKSEVGTLREQLQVSPARVEEMPFQMALESAKGRRDLGAPSRLDT